MTGSFALTASFFDALVERHGDDVRSSHWGSDESQRRRFDVLARVADLSGARVLDVGCGVARLADVLAEGACDVDYVGIDLSTRAIETARAARPGLDLRVANVLDLDPARERFDVVLANGIFYRLGTDGVALAHSLIRQMWSLAAGAVAFTSLSGWGPDPEDDELHLDPLETLALARSLTPLVVFRHDYMPHDFALYLYRESPHR